MRLLALVPLLVLASASAAAVREYTDDRWKAVIIQRATPDYPLEARRARLTGNGRFRLSFARNGRLTSVTTLQSTGHEMLDAAAIGAFRQWRAKPGPRRELDIPISYVMLRHPHRQDAWPVSVRSPRSVLREFGG